MDELDQIEEDLTKLLDQKIRRLLYDHLKLCDAVGISLRSSIPGALAAVVLVAVDIGKMSRNMTANDFAGACFEAFESHKKERRHDRGE